MSYLVIWENVDGQKVAEEFTDEAEWRVVVLEHKDEDGLRFGWFTEGRLVTEIVMPEVP